jgi:hypothetical protein
MLDTQYRMHPDISAFPNKAFYDSRLKDGTRNEDDIIKAGLDPPVSAYTKIDETGKYRTVTFLHHLELENAQAKSTVNEGEARIIYDVVLDLLFRNPVRRTCSHVTDVLTHSAQSATAGQRYWHHSAVCWPNLVHC